MLPLIAIGTPANGARSPATTASASAKAFSPSTSMNALMTGSRASMRRSAGSPTPGGLASLRRATEHARITVAIASPRHLKLLDGIDCRVLIEVNVGQDRCGLDPADEDAIVTLARQAGERFRGLQGYEGHAVLLPG